MRYSGLFGFGHEVETAPGVKTEVITEKKFTGDVEQRTETLVLGENMIPAYGTNTSVSVLSRGEADYDFSNLRWVEHAGKKWRPRSIVHQRPRIIVYLGEVWHG